MSLISRELARFIVETRWEDLPEVVIHEAKMLLMDSVGCALGGMSTDPGKMAVALAKRLGGTQESSIIGNVGKVSCTNAVLANGQLINALDYDAVMPGGHAPPYMVPPPIAMAECESASGKELVLATALGFETAARLASAIPSFFSFEGPDKKTIRWAQRFGYAHGNFGAAAGAGKILKLDTEKMTHALALAGHLSQVITHARYSFSEQRHMTKYGVPGWQDTGAISSVLLAEMGFRGDTDLLDSQHGFFEFAGFEQWRPENILKEIGKAWLFPKVQYKPYPCCRMFHTTLACFYNIIDRYQLKADDIENITVSCHPNIVLPLFENNAVDTVFDAQFNPRYLFAVAAHSVRIGPEWQDNNTMKNARILEFMRKVKCVSTPGLTGAVGGPGKVEVLAGGKLYTEERLYPGGTPGTEFQLTDKELEEKFRHNAERVLTQPQIDRAVDMFFNLEKVKSVPDLMKELTV